MGPFNSGGTFFLGVSFSWGRQHFGHRFDCGDVVIRVGIVGCGVVGAAIAYHLSRKSDYSVTVWEQRSPLAFGATGAALGVLMAAITPKLKGKHVRLRLESLRQFDNWIKALQIESGLEIPYNRQGIVQLVFDLEQFERWEKTITVRSRQGFTLERWSLARVMEELPECRQARLVETQQPCVGAIYSSVDRQVDPVALTQACRKCACLEGSQIYYETTIDRVVVGGSGQVCGVQAGEKTWPVDVLIVAAGLGSMPLTMSLQATVPVQPVLGQALKLGLSHPWRTPSPVINGGHVHLVPLTQTELWVGATVEFPAASTPFKAIEADPDLLEKVLQQAIALCPALSEAAILETWSGLRPRPVGQAAPIIQELPGYKKIFLATGHYRNGVLLAPITAQRVDEMLAEVV